MDKAFSKFMTVRLNGEEREGKVMVCPRPMLSNEFTIEGESIFETIQ